VVVTAVGTAGAVLYLSVSWQTRWYHEERNNGSRLHRSKDYIYTNKKGRGVAR
jgi:hypothetical protein